MDGVTPRIFTDRQAAGRALASRLDSYRDLHPVVLALPRGGVPVAAEVARALGTPLDVVVVRKVGVPFQPELGMGAVGEGGVRVVDAEMCRLARVSDAQFNEVQAREEAEVARRAQRYRAGRPMVPVAGRTVILVDDGIATGGTARAAIEIVRALGAARVVLAVPVAPPDTVRTLREVADDVVVVETPEPFIGVGRWYRDFEQTSDQEVARALRASSSDRPVDARSSAAATPTRGDDVDVRIGRLQLPGTLAIPAQPLGLVAFAHGSGSSRLSPRNISVARELQRAGLATLLFDLLTDDEALVRSNVFDIELLAGRLLAATNWCRGVSALEGLAVGYFGASTGAAAALWAASEDDTIAAVVSRGGRPDLAGERLRAVQAPTLLIVGGADREVLALNRVAADALPCEHRVEVVPHAGHLFEEPGALDRAAQLASDWFVHHLEKVTTD